MTITGLLKIILHYEMFRTLEMLWTQRKANLKMLLLLCTIQHLAQAMLDQYPGKSIYYILQYINPVSLLKF